MNGDEGNSKHKDSMKCFQTVSERMGKGQQFRPVRQINKGLSLVGKNGPSQAQQMEHNVG